MTAPAWKNERYQHLGLLGRGSFAEVHLAFDRLRGHEVALKLMHRGDELAIGELRKEFRALRDIDHPNVVALHELHADPTECFVTMEAVRGLSLGDYARQEGLASRPERVPEILACLAQLCEAVAALHEHGLLHRDLKPANVMVSDEGRLILLDAGLAKNIESQRTDERYVVGTLAFMAPEQAMAERLDEASDWYAFGVMAFELFTGKVPFHGESYIAQLQAKTLGDAPSLASLAPHLLATHPETVRMVDRLLSRQREVRPALAELRAWLAPFRKVDWSSRRRVRLAERVALVGRDRELGVLDEALVQARARGRAVAVVDGPSGMGKSALVHHWLTQRGALGACALVGRCYQGELTPFAGLDEILTTLIGGLDRSDLEALLAPHEIAVLQQTFGRRIVTDDAPSARGIAPPDPLIRRRLLLESLHRLVLRLASARTVILALDDAQWAAPETLALIAELADRPWPDGLCLLIAKRPDDEGEAALPLRADLMIRLGPLDRDAAMQVARRVTAGSPIPEDALLRVVAEAAGHPFLLEAFAVHADAAGAPIALTLEAIVSARCEGLDADARAILATLAVAAEPLPNHVVLQASGLATSSQSLRPLFAAGLVRRAGRAGTHTLMAHDRFASVLRAWTDAPTRRARHLAIAEALVAIEDGEPELAVAHYLAAGAIERVLPLVTKAARRLRGGLALSRSESLYHIAIAHAPDGPQADSVFALKSELAELLVEARRNEDAARLLLELARHPEATTERAALQARAAIELIRSGHVDEGFGHARASLRALGVKVSKRRASVLPIIAWHRLRLAVRGQGFRLRPASEVPARLLERIDWCQ
ncbi:MAG: protein kinase, partial [Deltaproteobacteria bacterium]|nr:protein kinase [Deltaproteobacteria bacterium]